MKRVVIFLSVALFVFSSLSALALPADFDNYTWDYYYNDGYLRVIDKADLLTDDEEYELRSRIDDIIWEYDFGVAIVTTDTLEGYSVTEFSEIVFDECGFGIGEDRDGIMLIISMEEREWNIDAHALGETVFSDYIREQIGGSILPYLSDGDYVDAFWEFLYHVDDYLAQAESGESYGSSDDYSYSDDSYSSSYGYDYYDEDVRKVTMVSVGIALVVSLTVVLRMKRGMKTARPQPLAHEYIRQGSFHLTNQSDTFLYRTVTKTKREKSSSSGGAGTSSKGSGSHSHTSGKF